MNENIQDRENENWWKCNQKNNRSQRMSEHDAQRRYREEHRREAALLDYQRDSEDKIARPCRA